MATRGDKAVHSTSNPADNPGATGSHSHAGKSQGCLSRVLVGLLALTAIFFANAHAMDAQVPAVVSSSQSFLTATGAIGAGPAVVDACGDVYINQSGNGGVVEVQAGTGKQIVISANNNGYNNGTGLAIDSTKSNLYFPTPGQWYSSAFSVVPISNCVAGGASAFGTNFGALTGYYYGTASNIAVDKAGDVFFTPTCCSNGQILEESASGNPSAVQASWPNAIKSLAADSAGDLYFTDGTANVYLLKAPYTAAAVNLGAAFKTPVGVSFDPAGNLFVTDSGNSLIYEVPLESGALNPADTFAVTSLSPTSSVAVDAADHIFISDYAGAPQEIKLGSAALPSAAVGATSSASISYVFNTAVTPSAITALSGSAPSTAFTAGTGGCSAGTAYARGASCTLDVNFAPSKVGPQYGAITFADASGNIIDSTFISGTGLGALVTSDPGVTTPIGTGLKAPQATTVDAAGNVYVTDVTANNVTEFPAGSTTGTVLSTGTLVLSGPSGIAVDGAGDIFVADTGNNRIVEIPAVNGKLNPANTVALSGGLKSPAGIAVGGAGGLYIADTGNNRLLYAAPENGTYNLAAAQAYGTGLSAPSAVTVDPNGNVFLADVGNNAVLEFPAPIGSQSQLKVISDLNAPSSLATDASGSLFVVDSGNATIYRYANQSGSFDEYQLVSTSVAAPQGIAADSLGNLYVTDPSDGLFAEINRVQAALDFGFVHVNSSALSQTATVENAGNQPLIFSSPSYTSSGQTTAGFTVTSDGCTGATVVPGFSCTLSADFTPPTAELNAQETLALNSNASSGLASIALIGSGQNLQPSTLTLAQITPAQGSAISAGTPVTLKATIGTGTSTASPGGMIIFSVGGSEIDKPVTGGSATLALPGGLPAGSPVVITAVYTGDSINYDSSSATLSENVAALPTSLSITVATPYTNPNSINDSSANANGPAITISATLSLQGTVIPGGTVSFYSGTQLLGIGSITAAGGGTYQAAITTTALRAGTSNVVENNSFLSTYNLSAVYSGDDAYSASTSNTTSVTVVAPPLCAVAKTCTIPGTSTAFPTTGATFAISPANPTITVSASTTGPQSGSTTLTLISYGGYNGVLSFTCSNLPQYATCAPYPGNPIVVPSTTGAPAAQTQVQFIINTNVVPTGPTASGMTWWGVSATGLLLLSIRRRWNKLRERGFVVTLALALLVGGSLFGLGGCSSNGGTAFVTPSGTTNIQVTVKAAQLVPGTTTNAVIGNDVNTGSFNIALKVQ